MKNILESLKLSGLFGKHSASASALIHPVRDWKIVAAFLGVCLLAGVGFAVQTYVKVAAGTLVEAPAISAKTGEALDVSALARLNEMFAEKEQRLAEVLSQRAPVGDPAR